MVDPKYTQVRLPHLGENFRINEIEKFKAEFMIWLCAVEML